jgi:hypothetical protein
MEKEWIPVIATLAGVLAGGGISTLVKWFEVRLQVKTENRKILLTKLEEVLELMQRFSLLKVEFVNNCLIREGEVIYINDLTKLFLDVYEPLARTQVLISIYAPDLRAPLEKVVTLVNDLYEQLTVTSKKAAFVFGQDNPTFNEFLDAKVELTKKIQLKIATEVGFKSFISTKKLPEPPNV